MARGIYRLGNIKSRGAQIVVTDLRCEKLEIYEAPCSLYALKNMIKDAVRRLWIKVSNVNDVSSVSPSPFVILV